MCNWATLAEEVLKAELPSFEPWTRCRRCSSSREVRLRRDFVLQQLCWGGVLICPRPQP
ncbi:unnamed protein product, partial [Effrenium voratum]